MSRKYKLGYFFIYGEHEQKSPHRLAKPQQNTLYFTIWQNIIPILSQNMKSQYTNLDRAALEVLRKTGINVLDAALVAKEALEKGRGRLKRARRCIELGDSALRQTEKTVTFAKAVAAAEEDKLGRRKRSVSDFRYLINRMMKRCGELARRRVRSLTPKECSLYIRQSYETPRQRNKARLAMSAVFTAAMKRDWCDSNPISKVPKENVMERKITILTREEIDSLLTAAEEYEGGICLAPVSIMLYAGVRPHEVARLQWSHINRAAGVIYIHPQHSKTGGARQVTIYPPLAALLSKIERMGLNKGLMVCPHRWAKHWAELHRRAGWTQGKRWIEDILRHTFASHHLVTFRSYAELQLEMGHRSAELLRTRYVAMEGVRREDNFWLLPAEES